MFFVLPVVRRTLKHFETCWIHLPLFSFIWGAPGHLLTHIQERCFLDPHCPTFAILFGALLKLQIDIFGGTFLLFFRLAFLES